VHGLCRYSIYLLYWYKSTNTDAEGCAEVGRAAERELKERANAAFKPFDFDSGKAGKPSLCVEACFLKWVDFAKSNKKKHSEVWEEDMGEAGTQFTYVSICTIVPVKQVN
jgi:hypothetical protein